jgi:tetratricopeptide (TPR) repeat protein
MVPGFITHALDAFRTMQAWPFWLAFAVLGAQVLIGRGRACKGLAIALIIVSGSLDAYHLFGRYHDTWGNLNAPIPIMKNSELAEAYRILKGCSARMGPGRLLSNLRPDVFDQSLTVAADRFTRGPLSPSHRKETGWTAALFNVHYRPFLSRRFPRAEWYDLGGRLAWPYGYLTLAIFPEGSIEPDTLERWVKADEMLQPLTSFLLHRRVHETDTDVLKRLAALYPGFKGDPFLESCFHEKAYLYFTRAGDNQDAEESLQRGLARGYPAAHFYYQLGHLYRAAGRDPDALRAFQKACSAPGNRTDAERYLTPP